MAPPVFAQKASTSQNDLHTRTRNHMAGLFGTWEHRVGSLGLSGAQKTKLKIIAQKNGTLGPALWNSSKLSVAQKKSQFGELSREVNAVFTPLQKQKIAAAKRESVGQLIGTMSWVSSELGLTVTQQKQMQQIAMGVYRRASVRGQAQTVPLRDVVADANSQIARILTSPQKMKWNVIQRAASAELAQRANLFQAIFAA